MTLSIENATTILRWATLLTVLVAGAASCIEPIEPEVGPLARTPCTNEDSDPDSDVSFRVDIGDSIFRRSDIDCVRCHTAAGATPIGLDETGFDIATYASLRRGGRNTGAAIIVSGQPCDSLLVQKVGPAPPIGARMPLSGPPYLSDLDLQLLRDWIAEGANDN